MYIHEKIMLCALDLMAEFEMPLIEVIGELCQAGFTLAAFTPRGIEKLHDELIAKKSESCSPAPT